MSIVKSIARAMERVAPLRLAEKWDNVGLLLESPITRQNAKSVLLTIDLTPDVLNEALTTPTSVIVSYHPTIFRPVSSFTLSNPLQASLLKCAAAGISVFSPHTALDSVSGGINDWLSQCLTGLGNADVRAIEPKDIDGAGAGRIVTYQTGVPLERIIAAVKAHLNLKYVQVATSTKSRDSLALAQSIAICAGSGGSMLGGVEADLYFTGEMAHHEVLAAVSKGTHVILCGHDNTERGYLPTLQRKLQASLSQEEGGPYEVIVSTQDRHPLSIV
ncbi:NIF3-like protein-like protein [Hysterangium stoloniferum]|nr:NIF3-like protein-like protein [Hysterangium stoloniferum]